MTKQDEKQANEVVSESNHEAPISITIVAYYKGFSLHLTKRDPKVEAAPLLRSVMKGIDWMIKNDFKPSWSPSTNIQLGYKDKPKGGVLP